MRSKLRRNSPVAIVGRSLGPLFSARLLLCCIITHTRMPSELLPPAGQPLTPVGLIERRIYLIRGQKVMLSPDLADLYQVETRALVQAVKRNIERFPEDVLFQLSAEEYANLKSQFVTSSWGRESTT
jgi:hypothetical protein